MTASAADMQIVPVPLTAHGEAWRLLFQGLPEAEASVQIAFLEQMAARDPHAVEGLLGAYRGGRLVGIILAQTQGGQSGAIWLPQLAAGEEIATAKLLLEATDALFARQRISLARYCFAINPRPRKWWPWPSAVITMWPICSTW